MLVQFIKLLILVDLGWIWLVFIYSLFYYKKYHSPFQYLVLYFGMICCIELLSKMHIYGWLPGDNLYLFYIYMPLEYVLLCGMYLKMFKQRNQNQVRLKAVLVLAFIIIPLLYILVADEPFNGWKYESFEPVSKLIVNGVMVALALNFFFQNLKNPTRYLSGFRSLFYLNSAVLLYFAGTFIIYVFMKKMIDAKITDTASLWLLNILLIFTFHIICAIALWQKDSRLMKTTLFG